MTVGQSKKMEGVNVSYEGPDTSVLEKKLQQAPEFAVSKDSNENAEKFLTLLKGKEYALNSNKEVGEPSPEESLVDKKEEKDKMISFQQETFSLQKERIENFKDTSRELYNISHSKFLELSKKHPGLITDGFLVDLKVGEQRYESLFSQLATAVNFANSRSLDLLESIEVEKIPLELLKKMNTTQEEVVEDINKKYDVLEEKVILKLSNVVMSIPNESEEVSEEEIYKLREEMIGCMFGKREKDYRQSKNTEWKEESKKEANFEDNKKNFDLKVRTIIRNLSEQIESNNVIELKKEYFDECMDLLYEAEDIKKIAGNNYRISDFLNIKTCSIELENLLKKNLYKIAQNARMVGNLKVLDTALSQLKQLGVKE